MKPAVEQRTVCMFVVVNVISVHVRCISVVQALRYMVFYKQSIRFYRFIVFIIRCLQKRKPQIPSYFTVLLCNVEYTSIVRTPQKYVLGSYTVSRWRTVKLNHCFKADALSPSCVAFWLSGK